MVFPSRGVCVFTSVFVLVTYLYPCFITSVDGLPTPIYDLQWDTVGEATGLTRAVWSAGTFPHDGIIQTTDSTNGGFVAPTIPSSTVTLTFPFTVRVGVIIQPVQPINGWHRIWSLHNGVNGADVVSIQRYATNPDIWMEFSFSGSFTNRRFLNSWDLIDDGAWHDLVFAATSTTSVALYIDGVQQTETNVQTSNPASAFSATSKVVYLGKSSYSDPPPNGAWDFLEIYNQAFTQTNVDEAFEAFYTGTIGGDPQIAGFHGQNFQFHGIPGEIFNLITSPTFQLNSKFVYLASGSCHYNHTQCWSHPGTYLSHLGFMIPNHRVQLVAGSHQQGLSLHIDGVQIPNETVENTTRTYQLGEEDEIHMTVTHVSNERVKLSVPSFDIIVVNSDMFFNLMISVTDSTLLQSGAKAHHYRHHHVASGESVYPSIPIHGLTGQTWRNAKYGADHQLYEGEPDGYLVESQNLFGCDFQFNKYKC